MRRAIAAAVAGIGITSLGASPAARADAVAYLVNVTMRPGYDFSNAGAALAYGQGICSNVGRGSSYAQNLAAIKADFATNDDYQAAYLINQAVNELCPALISQLRRSAAHYSPASQNDH